MGRDRHQAKKLLVLAAVGLMLAAGVWGAAAAANAHGSKPALGEASAFWKRCSVHVTVWQFEISPVEVLHTTCGAARHVIERGHVRGQPWRADLLDSRIRLPLEGDPAAGGPVAGQPAGGRVLQARHAPDQLRLGLRELSAKVSRTRRARMGWGEPEAH